MQTVFVYIILLCVLSFAVFEIVGFIRDIIKRKKVKDDLKDEETKTNDIR